MSIPIVRLHNLRLVLRLSTYYAKRFIYRHFNNYSFFIFQILNMKSLLIYIHLYYLISNWEVMCQTTDTVPRSSEFVCENGEDIDFIDVCDGVPDCKDGSDERCDDQAILFYHTTKIQIDFPSSSFCWGRFEDFLRDYGHEYQHYDDENFFHRFFNNRGCSSEAQMRKSLNVTGIFLNDDKEFSVIVKNDLNQFPHNERGQFDKNFENVTISPNGSEINIFYSYYPENFRKRVTRHNVSREMIRREEPIRSLVMDWMTSNMYYIANSQIKVCDQNLIICINLQSTSKLKNPIFLAISAKHRLLFWIDQRSQIQSHLFKYSLNKNTKPILVRQDLKSPKWLTIDSAQDRVYWLDDRDDGLKFYSSNFEGTDVKISSRGISISVNTSSFAVFDGSVYWPDTNQKYNLMKCSVFDCEIPTIFKDFSAEWNSFLRDIFSVGNLMVDHRPRTQNEVADPCSQTTCSHLCLSASETTYNCFCDGFDQPLPSNMSNGYCHDVTLIVAYQDSLYVVGLLNDNVSTPIIRTSMINISSVSSISYNSIDGSVILTEMEKQKIYTWKAKTEELELILDDGLGTIDSIEVDNHANNLYWIDSRTYAIKVMNLYSRASVKILTGNSTYSPIKFTLVPPKGYMVVLFLKESSTVVIERISMDGGPYTRKSLSVDEENDNIERIILHYMRETNWIFLLDGQTNEIKYFSDKKTGLQNLANLNHVGNIESITSLRNYLIWSEDDLTIRRATIDTLNLQINSAQKISLGIERTNLGPRSSSVKIANVLKQTVEPRFAKCLQNNGGCEKLCLSSSKYLKYTCYCPEGEELVNNTLCRKPSPLDIATRIAVTKEPQSHKSETNSTALEGNTPKLSNRSKADVEVTTAVLHQTKSIPPTTELGAARSYPAYQNLQPCPVCQNLQPTQDPLNLENKLKDSSSSSISSGLYLFYAALIVIPAILLGFVAGYYSSRARLLENRRRLLSNGGILELARVEPGNESTSTTTLNRNS